MVTKITIENFKKLETISFPLSQSVVIIGPNNSGKSTVFQALCLWEIGVKNFIAAYSKNALNRQGTITINRRDLINSPISDARFLWNNKKVLQKNKQQKGQVHIPLSVTLDIEAEGVIVPCRVEFTFSNAESFSCKIISGFRELIHLYENDKGIHFGFLQPMSGISTSEDKLTIGSIDRKLGEGKTAEVLRNICFEILNPEIKKIQNQAPNENWNQLCQIVKIMFGATLLEPEFIKTTGLINLEYIEDDIKYDIASAGRGFQQTLLLFAYMFANPGTILLLDEPDAHLEVIRQRDAFQRINELASELDSQLLIASHSEVVLNEAASSSKVIALIENTTHELNVLKGKNSIKYIRKALTDVGWEKYYLARTKGHVLYLEGSTDLQMLQVFANKLKHSAENLLRTANVSYTGDNVPNTAVSNFVALQEIFPNLKGLALFDNLPGLQENPKLEIINWEKRELENYFARPELLEKYANILSNQYKDISSHQLVDTMKEVIQDYTLPVYLRDKDHIWWDTAKLSDDWLDQIFPEFYMRINKPIDFYKRDYYRLISLMERNEIPLEISDKLDKIYTLLH